MREVIDVNKDFIEINECWILEEKSSSIIPYKELLIRKSGICSIALPHESEDTCDSYIALTTNKSKFYIRPRKWEIGLTAKLYESLKQLIKLG